MSNITNLINGIIEKDGKILLLKKIKYNDYTFPGGKSEDGESDIDALRREIAEEAGVEVAVNELIGTYSFQSNGRSFQRKVFKVNVQNGIPRICEPDVFSELIYAPREEALNLILAPNIGQAIKDYKK